MKRVSSVLVGIVLLLTGLSLVASQSRAMAMNSSGGDFGNSCSSSYPAPYTGGASIAKFFHLSDGSTVTITATGAVIKQSRCSTPYREGWISVSDICSINSAQDLNGRLSSGSSNPNGSGSFAGCPSNTQSPSGRQRPTSVTIINNNSQSQSQSQAQGSTQTTSSASSNSTSSASTAQAQVKAATTTSAAPAQTTPTAAKTLPNTGAGSIAALFGTASVIGGMSHMVYTRRLRP